MTASAEQPDDLRASVIDRFRRVATTPEQATTFPVGPQSARIAKARTSAQGLGLMNVEFVLGEIEMLPLPEASVDPIISKGVDR
jgi:hypothetical protein